jgi:hypothetical protein
MIPVQARRRKRPRSANRLAEAIILSDLPELVDKTYIDAADPDLWSAIPYRAAGFSGVMLAEGEGPSLAPLTLRLHQKGVYRIWLGVYRHLAGATFQIRVRLSADLCCQKVGLPKEAREGYPSCLRSTLYEILWKEADLTGQDLILAGFDSSSHEMGALAYLRLEPIEKMAPKPERRVVHPLTITNDGHGIFGEVPHFRPEDLLESLEKIPDGSCVRTLIWGSGCGDVCNYPTTVGTYLQGKVSNYWHPFNRIWSSNLELWRKNGWNSLELLREYTRRRNWEFQVYIRMEAFAAQFPWDWTAHSDFFYAHPEYHCLDRNGQRVGRLSYAYPEVQEHMLRLIREIADYGPDGICLCLTRGLPLVLYEPLMVELFKNKHHVDPRTLKESDPRWMAYQAEVITPFMRKVKNTLGARQRLSAMVPGGRIDCERWGLDVATWVREGVVNDLLPVGQSFNKQDVHYDDPDNLDFRYFSELAGREKIRLIPMLYAWVNKDYPGWRRLMYSFLDRGADGYGVWDGCEAENLTFPRIADIGYEAKRRAAPPKDKVKFRKVRLLSMNGYRMDRYHYFEGV